MRGETNNDFGSSITIIIGDMIVKELTEVDSEVFAICMSGDISNEAPDIVAFEGMGKDLNVRRCIMGLLHNSRKHLHQVPCRLLPQRACGRIVFYVVVQSEVLMWPLRLCLKFVARCLCTLFAEPPTCCSGVVHVRFGLLSS